MDTNFDVTLKYVAHLLKYVQVSTHSEMIYEGWLKDIDPLSGNLLLVNFEDSDSKSEPVILVQGHDCESVEVLREDETMKNSIQYFFNKEGLERLKSSTKAVIEYKKRLLSWLEQNRLEIEESEDKIIVCNSVTIHPPYTIEDCISNNGRVLVMTKNLISSMPATSEEAADSD
ncbi:hypothetical protein AVEN_264048-1 [Araneus ventricosus]|uniref:AD domain-containing protein n=1 Tax=Araneus ventricosus TaxID=182803 RepID=A0A4Y2UTQ5_ARAVE|nr:hypothetical protein AVEN_264048-1 [Araneus ventricosus]